MSNTEIKQLAKRHLERLLREAGIEFDASPRERGVDLTAILGSSDHSVRGARCRIRIGANEKDRFGVQRRWKEEADLLVYEWNVSTTGAEIYALSYDEAVALLKERGHTQTRSWNKENGGYSLDIGNGDKRTWWTNHLSRYSMDARKLREKIASICNSKSLDCVNRATMET